MRPSPTPGCWPTGRCRTRSAKRPGTCACCATRARSPPGWRTSWPPAVTSPRCCPGPPMRCRCWPARISSFRGARQLRAPWSRRCSVSRTRSGRSGRAGTTPPRAAAHRVRRPARSARRGRGLRGDQRHHRRHPRCRAAGGDAAVAVELGRRAARPDRRHRDGTPGWHGGRLRLRRRCDLRVRVATRRIRAPKIQVCPAGLCGCGRCWRRRRPTRRSASTPTCARRAATARSCARWLPTRATTRAGHRPGRPRRCCARGSWSATPSSVPASSR